MILNFYYLLNLFLYILILLPFFNFNLFKFLETSYLMNLTSKIILDDFIIFNFYYIWSNFFYMFIFFFFVSLLFYTYKSFFLTNKLFIQMCIITFGFYFNITDYFFSNNYDFNIEYSLYNYNILLNNSINKIHPLLLYSSLFYLFYYLFFTTCNIKYLHLNFNSLKLIYTLTVCFKYLSFTLFLGSWWAFQEGSWGGWWDWDVSEVFGLYILIVVTKSFHRNYIITTSNSNRMFLLNYFISLLIFYFFMQLNFSLISHNFNLSSSSSFVSNLVYLVFIITFIFTIILSYIYSINFFNVKSLTFKVNFDLKHGWTFKIKLITFFNLIVILSLFPIFSSWLWLNFSVEYLFNIVNFHDMLVFLFFLVLTFYWGLDYIILFLLFIFVYSDVNFFLLISSFTIFSSCQLLHYFSFLCLFVVSFFNVTDSSNWLHINYGFNQFFHSFYNILKIDYPFLNVSKYIFNTNHFKIYNFNWWYDFSSLDFKTFILYFTNNSFCQVFIHDVEQNIFLTSILSLVENSILNFIFFMFFIFIIKKNRKLVIIF